jgi:integrase
MWHLGEGDSSAAWQDVNRYDGAHDREENDRGATLLICLALLRGAKPKVISEALGHSSVAFTMDTYSHIISGMQEDMMALLDEVIPSGTRRQNQASNIA